MSKDNFKNQNEILELKALLDKASGKEPPAPTPKPPTYEPKSKKCLECGTELDYSCDFCPSCGTPKNCRKKLGCSKCGAVVSEGQEFCHKCGNKVVLATTYVKEKPLTYNAAPSSGYVFEASDDKTALKKFVIIILLVLAVFFIIVIVAATTGPNMARIYRSLENKSFWCELSDDKESITVDTNPLDIDGQYYSEAWDAILKLNEEFDFPDSVESKMRSTRALDGRQTETHNGITVSWTYHPDNGLEVIYQKD